MTAVLPYVRDPTAREPFAIPTLGPCVNVRDARIANLECKVARMEHLLRQVGILTDAEAAE